MPPEDVGAYVPWRHGFGDAKSSIYRVCQFISHRQSVSLTWKFNLWNYWRKPMVSHSS